MLRGEAAATASPLSPNYPLFLRVTDLVSPLSPNYPLSSSASLTWFLSTADAKVGNLDAYKWKNDYNKDKAWQMSDTGNECQEFR